jgi:hypothetical protein
VDKELKVTPNQEPACTHSAVQAIYEGKPYTFGLKQKPEDCMSCSWFALVEEMRQSNSWMMVQIIIDPDERGETNYVAEMFPDGLSSIRGNGESPAQAIRALINELTDFWKDQESL